MSQVVAEIERLAADWDEAARAGPPMLVFNGGGNERRRLVKAFGEARGLWDIQTSMRSVEEEVKVVIWDPQVYAFDTIPNTMDAKEVTVIVIVAILSAVLGALLPAIRAARLHPVEALRWE